MGINVEWTGYNYNFVNVYASCNVLLRRTMWINLIKVMSMKSEEKWFLGGDFNVDTRKEERLGKWGNGGESRMEEFRSFIEDMKFNDMSCIGGKFTWFNGCGNAMRRLDKFLLSDNPVDLWKITTQRIGQRDISNHYPIWLKSCSRDWGSKPFRFNNYQVGLKGKHVEEQIKADVAERRGQEHPFFHNSLKERYIRNFLNLVDAEGGRVKDVKETKNVVKSQFEAFFKEPCYKGPVPDGIKFNELNDSDKQLIEMELFGEEIKEAIWSWDGDKSVGPDDFSFELLKKGTLNVFLNTNIFV
ncbi:uncharacterized protein LOC127138072 [Lathyrus oleraceus]|uniref:uncharacterized protein LOC127138072 n=1 Tax=Pisum sativum TaxID=3888 RepID=UPI0021D0A14F|nr:uncharacterized protein LOC127138072 [Pisum sativum]